MGYAKPGDGLSGASARKAELSLRRKEPVTRRADALSPAARKALAERDERRAVAEEVAARKAREEQIRKHRANLDAIARMVGKSGDPTKLVGEQITIQLED